MNPTCLTCRFFDPFTNPASRGFCRRYPPVPTQAVTSDTNGDYVLNSVSSQQASAWPEVAGYDWCGEHQPAPIELTADKIGAAFADVLNLQSQAKEARP